MRLLYFERKLPGCVVDDLMLLFVVDVNICGTLNGFVLPIDGGLVCR